jgi:hypothetical protein
LQTPSEIPSTFPLQEKNVITSNASGESIILNGNPGFNELYSDRNTKEIIPQSQPKKTDMVPGTDSGQRSVSSRFSVKSVSENISSKYDERQSTNENDCRKYISNKEASKTSSSSVLLPEITEEVSFA